MKLSQYASLLAFVAVMANATLANAHQGDDCDFIPKNELSIPEGYETGGGLTEAQFNTVIDKVSKYYTPVMKAKGGTLVVKRLWKKTDVFQNQNGDTLNAFTMREGSTWYIAMFGGLARHQYTTPDAFTLVMCHEVGHNLGGFPQKMMSTGVKSWASTEGQSDYFATTKCSRSIWMKEDNAKAIAQLDVPAAVTAQCSVQHKSGEEIAMCVRGAMAGRSLGQLLWSLSNSSKTKALSELAGNALPQFDTPSTTTVSATNLNYPDAQCRLDTYFSGAVCGAAYSDEFGQNDGVVGACAQEKNDKIGFRPRCWYKPKTKMF